MPEEDEGADDKNKGESDTSGREESVRATVLNLHFVALFA
jgi:hypothetical protein